MTMLDRYLYAVQSSLGKNRSAADIVAEIGDDLQSQIEDRERELARPLTQDEQAALIKAYGHPRVVAGRYGAVQHLIGPELLPFYWSTLRLVATIVIAIELIGGAVSALVSHNGALFFGALGAAWNSLIWIFGIVTVVFALSERAAGGGRRIGIPASWDPRRLPTPGVRSPVPRSSALAEFVANFIALLVLLDAPGPHRIPLDIVVANVLRSMHATLTPAWHAAYVGTAAGCALLAISAIIVFVQPRLTAMHEFIRAVASVSVVLGVALTLQAGPWVQPAAGPLNTAALYGLVAALVILALQITLSMRILLRKPAIQTIPARPMR